MMQPDSSVYTPRTPSPDLPELWGDENVPPRPTHPGPGWIPNTSNEEGEILHDVEIPSPQGMGPAQWVQYDFDTDSPELLVTMGWGHSIHSSPLRARPRPYPIAPLTKKERFLFHMEQVFTLLVDTALDRERDVGLRAEVQRYRRMTQHARSLTYCLADLKAEYNEARTEAHESATRLAYTNAHDRLMTRVLTEVMKDQTLAP
jgi:hypothetical protein